MNYSSHLPEAPYPWQKKAWDLLKKQWPHWPHGFLFSGQEGLGVEAFSYFVAQCLLCEESTSATPARCDVCKSCHLLKANTHPDLITLSLGEGEELIKIDDIRNAMASVMQTGHQGLNRVILMTSAEAMNVNSANALLKTLEEPPPHVFIILCTSMPTRLLPTLRSRCEWISFLPDGGKETLDWLKAQTPQANNHEAVLKAHHGFPLLALKALSDPGALLWEEILFLLSKEKDFSSEMGAYSFKEVLDGFLGCVNELIQIHMGGKDLSALEERIKEPLRNLKEKIPLSALFEFYTYLIQQKKKPFHRLNQTLLLEDLLFRWKRLYREVSC